MKFSIMDSAFCVKKGGTAAIRFLDEASGHAAFSPKEDIDAFRFCSRWEIGSIIDGIAPIRIGIITKKVFEGKGKKPIKMAENNKNQE